MAFSGFILFSNRCTQRICSVSLRNFFFSNADILEVTNGTAKAYTYIFSSSYFSCILIMFCSAWSVPMPQGPLRWRRGRVPRPRAWRPCGLTMLSVPSHPEAFEIWVRSMGKRHARVFFAFGFIFELFEIHDLLIIFKYPIVRKTYIQTQSPHLLLFLRAEGPSLFL